MRENDKTSRHRWWKSWWKPNTFVRHLAVPSSNQPHNSLKQKTGQTQPILIKPAKERLTSAIHPSTASVEKNMPWEASYKAGGTEATVDRCPVPPSPSLNTPHHKTKKIPTEYSGILERKIAKKCSVTIIVCTHTHTTPLVQYWVIDLNSLGKYTLKVILTEICAQIAWFCIHDRLSYHMIYGMIESNGNMAGHSNWVCLCEKTRVRQKIWDLKRKGPHMWLLLG